MLMDYVVNGSVQNLEIIEPFHSALLGTCNKKRSLFHMLKTTKTIGGYVMINTSFLMLHLAV